MRLVALELLERRQPGIGVAEADDETDRDLPVGEVVHERPPVRLRVEWPAGGVHHEPRHVPRFVDLPQLLDADAVALRIAVLRETELLDQQLAEVAARAFGEQHVLRVQFHAELEVGRGLAVLADAQVAGDDAAHRTTLVVQHLRGREAGEDLDPERLGLLPHPARDVGEADDVVAVVLEDRRQHPVRRAPRRRLGQEQEPVLGHRHVQRRALLLPVGNQFGQAARVHHRARQDVRADLRTLLEHADADVLALLGRELLQADRRGESRGPGADDDHVVLHRFARAELFDEPLLPTWIHGSS